MNKLGFAIKRASQGASNSIECNKGQWTSKVVDIREYLKLFNGLQGTDNIVTFMSFDDSGCFLTQLRAISGRIGDFLSGWIYIPNTIEATGEDVMNAYNYVRNILSQSNLSEYKEEIESFFSKDFPAKEFPAQYISSKGQLFGVRYLGHYTMNEIVGEHRYQPYYSNFKAVFLLDKEGNVKIAQEAATNFRNLTDKEIAKTAVLIPPTSASLQLLGRGTKLLTQDGSNFTTPLLVTVGATVSFILSRFGFENMKVDVPVTSEKQNLDLTNVKIVWRKRISSSMFAVMNSKHEEIKSGVRVFVNGTDITYQELTFTEDECKQATVKVTAPDYETNEQKRNLLNEDFEIVLRRKIKSSRMMIELANGSMAEMTLESKDLSDNYESPLKGYDYDEDYGRNGGDKILRISSWFVWKQRLWGFFAAFIAVMLIFAYAAFDAWTDTHHLKFGLPPWEEDQPIQTYPVGGTDEANDSTKNGETEKSGEIEQQGDFDTSIEAAIKYLDSNSTWTKSELEKYPDLNGLFDDMNNFDLANLLYEWKDKLSASQKFKSICESAQKTYNHGWNPKQDPHNPTYNKPNDEQISLTNYINWLDRDQTPQVKSGGSAGNSGTSGKAGTGAGKNGVGNGTSGSTKANSGNAKGGTNGDL